MSLFDNRLPFTKESNSVAIVREGSLVLDCAVRGMERLAARLVYGSSRYSGALAKRAVPSVLGEPVEEIRNHGTTAD
jgi:hypothetical protein